MKITFVVYHDVLEDRVITLLNELEIDFYTKWEGVKGKGHNTDPHLGTRTFPGHNSVLMIAFNDESIIDKLIEALKNLNAEVIRNDDKVRLFQVPLERIF